MEALGSDGLALSSLVVEYEGKYRSDYNFWLDNPVESDPNAYSMYYHHNGYSTNWPAYTSVEIDL